MRSQPRSSFTLRGEPSVIGRCRRRRVSQGRGCMQGGVITGALVGVLARVLGRSANTRAYTRP
eukprot:5951333-Prymnesium_polylepis.1